MRGEHRHPMIMVKVGALMLVIGLVSVAHAEGDASTQARSAMAATQGNAARVRQLLFVARRAHVPLAQVTCVDSALTRADVAVRASRERYADLRAAMFEGERSRVVTALGAILAGREAARAAANDADACMIPGVRAPLETTAVRIVVDHLLPPDAAIFQTR